MNKLDDLRKAAEARQAEAVKAEKWLAQAIRLLQGIVFTAVLDEITRFTFGADGALAFRASNASRAGRVAIRVETLFRRQAKGLVPRIFARLLRLFEGNKKYFKVEGLATESVDARALARVMLAYGMDVKTGELIPGGYLDAVLQSAPIRSEVAREIQQALSSRIGVDEFRRRFRANFVNPQGTGYLERHYARFTHDLFMEFDRNVQTIYAAETGMTHFIYAGTEVEDSRPHCLERLNRIYTLTEAQTWQALNWAGKIPGRPVMQQMGGYNCRHSPMFVSDELAEILSKQQGKPVNGYNQVRPKRKRRPRIRTTTATP